MTSFLHRLDFLLHYANWHRNPVCRYIENAHWKTLEADMADERAGRLL